MQGHLLIFGDVLPTPLYEIKMSFSSGFPEEAFEIRTERIDSIATTVAFSNLLKGMLEETSVADTVALLENEFDIPVSNAAVVIVDNDIFEAWCAQDEDMLVNLFPGAQSIYITRLLGWRQVK